MQLQRLGKPRHGLQIFDTRVDFHVPVPSGGKFYYSITSIISYDCNLNFLDITGYSLKNSHIYSPESHPNIVLI